MRRVINESESEEENIPLAQLVTIQLLSLTEYSSTKDDIINSVVNKNDCVDMCDSDPDDESTPTAKIPPTMDEVKQCCQTFSMFLDNQWTLPGFIKIDFCGQNAKQTLKRFPEKLNN